MAYFIRKILVSVKFVSAILGPEVAMDTWKKCLLSAGKTHVHKIPRFRGGGILGFGGGGCADFIFMGARIFLILGPAKTYILRGNQ